MPITVVFSHIFDIILLTKFLLDCLTSIRYFSGSLTFTITSLSNPEYSNLTFITISPIPIPLITPFSFTVAILVSLLVYIILLFDKDDGYTFASIFVFLPPIIFICNLDILMSASTTVTV